MKSIKQFSAWLISDTENNAVYSSVTWDYYDEEYIGFESTLDHDEHPGTVL